MEGAAGVLLSIAGPSSMTLHEVNEAAMAVAAYCEPDANVIFGAFVDDSMGEEMRVTVIAAGFQQSGRPTLRPPTAHRATDTGQTRAVDPLGLEPAEGEGDVDDMEIPDFLKG